jgi:hypothetical protein
VICQLWDLDADYARDLDDKRSTMGYVFTLTRGPICWKSMVQSTVAMSMIEAEYMAVAEAAKEALWLTWLVKELGIPQGGVRLNCDSQSVSIWQRTKGIMREPSTLM